MRLGLAGEGSPIKQYATNGLPLALAAAPSLSRAGCPYKLRGATANAGHTNLI
jgi:hypothetical protein